MQLPAAELPARLLLQLWLGTSHTSDDAGKVDHKAVLDLSTCYKINSKPWNFNWL